MDKVEEGLIILAFGVVDRNCWENKTAFVATVHFAFSFFAGGRAAKSHFSYKGRNQPSPLYGYVYKTFMSAGLN